MNPSRKKSTQWGLAAPAVLLFPALALACLPLFAPPLLPRPASSLAVAAVTSFLSQQDGGGWGWRDSWPAASFSTGSRHFGKVSIWEDAGSTREWERQGLPNGAEARHCWAAGAWLAMEPEVLSRAGAGATGMSASWAGEVRSWDLNVFKVFTFESLSSVLISRLGCLGPLHLL